MSKIRETPQGKEVFCDHSSAAGSIIRVMTDVHPDKAGTIGLTMTVGESLLPLLETQ